VHPRERSQKLFREMFGEEGPRPPQTWLTVDPKKLEALVTVLPSREDVQIPVEEQLIVEFCSR
jgi:small subunit ribosomal protein S4